MTLCPWDRFAAVQVLAVWWHQSPKIQWSSQYWSSTTLNSSKKPNHCDCSKYSSKWKKNNPKRDTTICWLNSSSTLIEHEGCLNMFSVQRFSLYSEISATKSFLKMPFQNSQHLTWPDLCFSASQNHLQMICQLSISMQEFCNRNRFVRVRPWNPYIFPNLHRPSIPNMPV